MLNVVSQLVLALCLLHVVGFYCLGALSLAVLSAAAAVLFFAILGLTASGNFGLSRALYFVGTPIAILACACLAGREAGLQYYLFPIVVFPFLLCSIEEKGLLALAIAAGLGAWCAGEVSDYGLLGAHVLSTHAAAIVYWSVIPTAAGLTVFQVGTFALCNHWVNDQLEQKVRQLNDVNQQLGARSIELDETITALKNSESLAVKLSRHAGMAEVATSVLHEVGNTLNSVNVSSGVVYERLQGLKLLQLGKAITMLGTGDGADNQELVRYATVSCGRLTEVQREVLNELKSMRQHIDQVANIVAHQQELARPIAVLEESEIADLVAEGLLLMQSAIDQHRVKVEVAHGLTGPVIVDRHQFLQILVTLLSNALDAVGGALCKKIRIRSKPVELGFFSLEVEDTGVGMDEAEAGRVFEYGFSTKSQGSGFGLHNSANIAKWLGGSLTLLRSRRGRGSCFALELPISPDRNSVQQVS